LTIFEKKRKMKILGYVLKTVSFYFVLVIILFGYNLFFEELPSDIIDTYEKIGYRFGQVIVIVLAAFLTYKLFHYGKKLILKSKNKIATIGKE
jgi:hypothetical protein